MINVEHQRLTCSMGFFTESFIRHTLARARRPVPPDGIMIPVKNLDIQRGIAMLSISLFLARCDKTTDKNVEVFKRQIPDEEGIARSHSFRVNPSTSSHRLFLERFYKQLADMDTIIEGLAIPKLLDQITIRSTEW